MPLSRATAQRLHRGKCAPMSSESKFSSLGHQASAGALGAPKTENMVPQSGEDTSQEFQNHLSDTGDADIDIDDLPHPDTLFFWARNNGDAGSRQLSVTPRCGNDRILHVVSKSATSEVSDADSSSSESPVNDNDDASHMNRTLDEGEGCQSDVTRLRAYPFSPQSTGQQLLQPGIKHYTEKARPNPASRNILASAVLKNESKTTCGPLTRARARAKALCTFPTSRKTQPYSAIEDDRLRELVEKGLTWEQIWMISGQQFAGRTLRSLQMRWSRNLRYTTPLVKRSQRRRGATDRAG
ncbi:uncharacterized protein BDW43DRAFT_316728 [Aspergillus alliaceus]|uniref:uncharacterized protein n=1 Tax=Petromyces alliaceus TaxID=209559 RepID=UPI0012A7026C|nr:uncharacterized protein BDW43DRAFT_316728 [Aspergillus alliaceus]KAB8227553.1 hypothetical protein BDW43DRAFT_316728 [Aspergillus alliaceus]